MIGKAISHYKILEKLGEGGMGVVYKAEDIKLKRTVALKFLPPALSSNQEAKERFIQEAQAASALEHPNICTIYEIDETEDGQLFIVMACYEGESLKKKIEREPLDLESAIDIASQIAAGLARAHEAGITHRDIKPSNIMVTKRGEVKTLDFGLAKLAGRAHLTKTGSTVGTVAYMSPEQARGEEVDNRTDIWSLGVVIYEMLTGQLPFRGEYDQAMMYSILNEEPIPLAELRTDIPAALEHIVNKALEKSPEARYQHVDEMLADFRRLKKETETDKRRAPIGRPEKFSSKLPRAFVLPAMLVFVALLTIVGYFFFGRKTESKERIPIAVVDFVNETDEKELNGLSGMLITALEQSRRLSVMTRSRMFDVLKQLDRQDADRIDEALGREICRHAQVNAMAIASIRKFGQLYSIDLKIIDPLKDRYLFAVQERAEGQSRVPELIDHLAEKTRKGLKEKQGEIQTTSVKVAAITTPNLDAYQHYFLGEQHINKLEWEKAREEFNQAIAIDSTFGLAYYRLAYIESRFWSWRSTQFVKEPMQKALALIDHIPEKQRYLVRALNAQLTEGMFSGAGIPFLKEMEKRYPDDKEMLFNIGFFAMLSDDLATASEYLEKVLLIDPTFERALQGVTDTYRQLHENEKLLSSAKRYMDMIGSADSYFYLAYAHAQLGDTSAALRTLGRGRELYPESFWISYGYSSIYQYLGQPDKAVEELKKALMLYRSSPKKQTGLERLGITNDYIYFEYGTVLTWQRKYDEAEKIYREGLELFPQNPLPLIGLGDLYRAQKKYAEAEEAYIKALKLNPKNIQCFTSLGTSYLLQKKYAEAEEVFTKALELSPRNILCLIGLGWCLMRQEKYAEAEQEFRKAAELSPKNSGVLNGLGQSLLRQRKYREAEEAFLKGLDGSYNPGCLIGLGRINIFRRDYEKAKGYYEKMLTSDKQQAKAGLGCIELIQKHYEEAERLLREALFPDKTFDEPNRNLGYLYAEQQRFDQALAFARKALAIDSSFANYNCLAWILVAGELDIEKGIELAKLALEIKPKYHAQEVIAYRYLALPEHSLGLAYLKKGEYAQAVKYLEQAAQIAPERQAIRDDLKLARQKLQEGAKK